MTAIALVIFIVSIVYVMIWSIKNEDARSIGDQTGIIKMRDPSAAPKSAGRFGRRRQVSASPPSEQTNRRN